MTKGNSYLFIIALVLCAYSIPTFAVKQSSTSATKLPIRLELVRPPSYILIKNEPLRWGEQKFHLWNKINTEKIVKAFSESYEAVGWAGEIDRPHLVLRIDIQGSTNPSLNIRPKSLSIWIAGDLLTGHGDFVRTIFGFSHGNYILETEKAFNKNLNSAFNSVVAQTMLTTRELVNSGINLADLARNRGPIEPRPASSGYDRFLNAVVKISSQKSQGTGFLVTNDGHIVTNYHVVREAKEANDKAIDWVAFVKELQAGAKTHDDLPRAKLQVTTRNGDKLTAILLATDIWSDLALLKISESPDVPLPFLDIAKPFKDFKIGDWVFVIGGPPNLPGGTHTMTRGIISFLGYFEGRPAIQHDAATNPGNSGGPLIHAESGKVIGLTRSSAYIPIRRNKPGRGLISDNSLHERAAGGSDAIPRFAVEQFVRRHLKPVSGPSSR